MTQHRDLDPFTAEQLLSGAPVDGEVGPLADLLAAAVAPARADELMGEAAAVAAFRDAAGASRPATVPAGRSAVGRALGLKVAIAVAAVAGAGITGAAVSGILPGGGGDSPVPVSAPSSSARPSASFTQTEEGTTSAPTDPADPRLSQGPPTKKPTKRPTKATAPTTPPTTHRPSTARPTAVPRSFYTMCATYLTYDYYDQYNGQYGQDGRPGDRRHRNADRLLDDPSYRPLVKAAGGKSNVRSYCMRLLQNSHGGSRAPEGATPSPRQSVRPSGRPTSDPTSRPTASQTGDATTALPPPRGR